MSELRDMIIGLIMFSGLVVGFSTFYGNIATTYGKTYTDLAFLNATSRTNTMVNQLKSSVETTRMTGIAIVDIPLTIASGVYNTLKLLFGSVNIFSSLLTDLTSIFGIPGWVVVMVMGIISTIIVFEIISGVLRYRV